ncbi:MAG TPA: methylmalonyl-CoA mutase family protein [Luteitalea sp.]|nr:methylmalonyl-CoA mutase family protein [Luteitalea sp.]
MAERSHAVPPLRLREAFPAVTTEAWDALVRQDLAGQSYETRLLWHTDEGLTVKPFYRAEDLSPTSETRDERLPTGERGLHTADSPQPTADGDIPTSGWQIAVQPTWSADAIRGDLIHDAGGNAVHELAWILAEAVERHLETGDVVTADADAPAAGPYLDRATEIVSAVGSAYFVEIAKLRALRRLWARALTAFPPTTSPAMRLHVRTSRANKSALDPGTNLLRVTTEAMSAVLGGADVVLVEPHGFDPHLAVNVQHLLAEEAHLGATADPAAGAYYIEWMTDRLGAAAWALFQSIESSGGYATAARAGLREEHLEAAREARRRDVATRRRVLVGVNTYPDVESPAPVPLPSPSPDDESGALHTVRLAEPFEAIRVRTSRHAAATGRIPRVHLLTRGDVVRRMARAAFSRNLFGCAGLAVSESTELPADADLIVLCAADADYPALVDEIRPAVSVPLIVAGRPASNIECLEAAGVDDFIYAGIDAVATLTMWQDRLGLAR